MRMELKLAGYEIVKKVGEQGAVTLYHARQTTLNRMVLLRVMEPKLSNVGEIRDFVLSAKEVSHFKHANVCETFDIGEQNGIFFHASELLEGKTIRKIVESEGPMPPKRVIKIAKQVVDALNTGWFKHRMMHKDISPDNIFITTDGFLKVTGFGDMRPTDLTTLNAFVRSGLLTGSLNFVSPEQAAESTTITFRTDIYSLGATLYFMLTGQVPFGDSPPIEAMKRHLSDRLPHPRELNKKIPPSLAQIVIRMMMKNPSDRYDDWDDVLKDLEKSNSGGMIPGKPGWQEMSTILPLKVSDEKVGTTDRKAVPAWIRVPFWTVLILWWILTFYALFQPKIDRILKIGPQQTSEKALRSTVAPMPPTP